MQRWPRTEYASQRLRDIEQLRAHDAQRRKGFDEQSQRADQTACAGSIYPGKGLVLRLR